MSLPPPAAPGPRGRSALHVIPQMHRASSWVQPDRSRIIINPMYAYMSPLTWGELLAYDETTPTGVYPGKMWRCSPTRGPDRGEHFLCWFGVVEDNPAVCSNNSRRVRIIGTEEKVRQLMAEEVCRNRGHNWQAIQPPSAQPWDARIGLIDTPKFCTRCGVRSN